MSRPTRGKTSSQIVLAARDLRQRATPAEKKLYEALRGRRLADLKFRRQHPFGPFILDVFCVEHQLEVELDGGIHAEPAQAAYDAARTEYLTERGVQVLRFTNDEVENDLPGVLERILRATKK